MYKRIFIVLFFCACIHQFGFAQQQKIMTTPKVVSGAQIEKPDLSEQVFTLQKENKEQQQQIAELKAQLTALQTQVNANYKLLDYSLGKVTKSAPVAFTVVAGSGNLTDAITPATNSLPGNYFASVIIDNAVCNGNPDAVVLATMQRSGFGYNLPTGIAVKYDTNINKWKIVINTSETNPAIIGLSKSTSSANMVAVASYYPYQINNGDTFNVMVIK
jgi:hypothetical protein